MSCVGSLMYAMVCTRPNISHVVGVLIRYMSKLGKEHRIVIKMVFKYLHGTTNDAICYQGRVGVDKVLYLHGFVDAEWARYLDHRRYTSGYMFNLFGGVIS